MRPRGQAEIDRAKGDGRWDRAYAGSATAGVPHDLATALAATASAGERFATLNSANRYAVIHRVVTASNPTTRESRIKKLVGMLAQEQTPHPQ